MILVASIIVLLVAPSFALPAIAGMLFWRWWTNRAARRAR